MAGPMTEGGLGRRAGLGAKLALRRLNALQSNSSSTEKEKKGKGREIALNSVESDVSPPKKAKDIDALITQELLVVYSRGGGICASTHFTDSFRLIDNTLVCRQAGWT